MREVREIEAEHVALDRGESWKVIETKRRISEWLLGFAFDRDQPHEVCRAFWHELLDRVFTDITMRYMMSGIYARCCQMNAEFDAGIAMLDSLVEECEQALHTPLTNMTRAFYEHERTILSRIRDELKAHIQFPDDPSVSEGPESGSHDAEDNDEGEGAADGSPPA